MKSNLKNRPKFLVETTFDEDMKAYLRASTEWFEGFEKELKEDKRQLTWISKKQDPEGRIVSEGIIHFIQEILGA